MQQLARFRTLVTTVQRNGLELRQPVQARRLRDPRDRGARQTQLGGDTDQRHPLPAQRNHRRAQNLCGRSRTVMRSRATIMKTLPAALPETSEPLAGRLGRDP